MLGPKEMSRLLIAAQKDQMEPVIQELYSHNVFHIQSYEEGKEEGEEDVSIGAPLQGASETSAKLVKIRSIESTFNVTREGLTPSVRRATAELRDAVDRELPKISDEVEAILTRRAAIETAVKDHEQQIRELTPFAVAPFELSLYRGYERISVFPGKIPKDIELPVLHEKFFAATKEGNFIAAFVQRDKQEEAERYLAEHGFSPLPVPKGDGVPADLLAEHKSDIEALKTEETALEERLDELKSQQAEFLAACEELLTIDVEQAEAPLRFAVTEQAFIVEGWVPETDVDRVKSGLALATGGKAYVTTLPMDEEHKPPVEYNNPTFAKPTEFIMDVYSRPRYDEIDPTIFVSIIFPIFFGIILGDVGYGIILLAVSLALRKWITSKDGIYLLKVLRNASISAIFFGILFAEVFGFEPWHPILFVRALNMGGEGGEGPDITGLLIFSIWIGVLQITLGKVIASVNGYRHHGMRGMLPQVGWILALWGILLAIWSMAAMPLMPDLTGLPKILLGINAAGLAGGVMILIGIIAIASESALELIEIPTLISHTMSYARLVAVGLSSVAIAMVVNFIALDLLINPRLENFTVLGAVFIAVGIVVLIGGHLGNCALGLVGGGLQSLRLQYVEFFTKFYKGGGEKYNPFGMLKRFTED